MDALENLPKEKLIELLHVYGKNLLALDGTWFQAVEQARGMEEAVGHDLTAWRRFTESEARRLRTFLGLPERAGIDGLKRALPLRMNTLIHTTEIIADGNVLVYRVLDCRVQTARARKGMPYHPCRPVGLAEHAYFARIIDDRFRCETLSCYPQANDPTCSCAWKFTLVTDETDRADGAGSGADETDR